MTTPADAEDPWYIVVMGTSADWSHGETHEYKEIDGVVGPFDTHDEALEYDRRAFLRERSLTTEILRLTAPGEDIYKTKYGHTDEGEHT